MPDWKSKESHTRLLAAMVAATPDMKLDYRKIASMYGEGATYDSIEGRFRIIKKEAALMKSEIENGLRPEAPARGNAGSTPKKPRGSKNGASQEGVITGRVSKSSNTTPTKRPNHAMLKKEILERSTSSSCSGEGIVSSESGSVQDSFYDLGASGIWQGDDGTNSQIMIEQSANNFVLPSYDDYSWTEV